MPPYNRKIGQAPERQDNYEIMKELEKIRATISKSGGSSYLIYTALLSQSGTNAPVATVLENTLGGAVVWSYTGVGIYTGTLTNAFVEGKTFFQFQMSYDTSQMGVIYFNNTDSVRIITAEYNDGTNNIVNANGLMGNSSIEIRVYP